MTEQIKCSLCGSEASEGENMGHAIALAKADGFVQRPGRWLCSDCAYVKGMKTTSAEYLKSEGVKKI